MVEDQHKIDQNHHLSPAFKTTLLASLIAPFITGCSSAESNPAGTILFALTAIAILSFGLMAGNVDK